MILRLQRCRRHRLCYKRAWRRSQLVDNIARNRKRELEVGGKLHILHVGKSNGSGGAHQAMVRIHQMMVDAPPSWGWTSSLALQHKNVDDESATQVTPGENGAFHAIYGVEKRLVSSLQMYARSHSSNETISVPLVLPTPTPLFLARQKPDVVNLHWVGKTLLSIADLRNLQTPSLWTMHDEWPLSGVRHYNLDHSKWRDLGTNWRPPAPLVRLIDGVVGAVKSKVVARHFHIVAPSETMANFAISRGISESRIHVIPYPLARSLAGEPSNRSSDPHSTGARTVRIVFISAEGTEDFRKGFHIVAAAMEHLKSRDLGDKNIELRVIGKRPDRGEQHIGCASVTYLGNLSEAKVVEELSGSDLLAHLSIADNFPLATQEALVAGTPVMMLSDVGNFHELSRVSGVVVIRDATVEAVARALGDFADDVEVFRRLRPIITRTARQMWAPPSIAKSYRSVFDTVLE